MTKEVLVSVSGIQMDIDANEACELVTVGDYYLRNNKHFIMYEEQSEDETEMTKNIIKLSDNRLELTKRGGSNSNMVFENGKSSTTYYDTPVGQLLIGLNTERFDVSFEEDKINIYIRYGLEVNYSFVSSCEIKILIKSRNAKTSQN